MARNSATARAQRSDPPSHHSWRQVFFLSRPLRQVAAPNDNLLLMHLPEDLLTLTSGHRRGVRQLHTIELRPPIPTSPSLQSPHLSAFTSKKCATAASTRHPRPLRIFLRHDSDLTLEVFAAQVASKLGKRARGIQIFAASRSQKRITDTVVVRERKNITPSRPTNQQEGHVTRTLSLGTAMWMLSSSEPRSIPFSETYMMSVWACIAPLVMSFVTLRQ